MMHNVQFLLTRGATFLTLLGAAVLAAPLPARADLYAYSEQSLSSFSFTGATIGTLSPGTSTSAVQTAIPGGTEAHIDVLDAMQSYVGPAPRPPENTFTPVGLVNPNYVRGDALITPTYTISNVAEGYLVGPGESTGSGAWSVTAPITVSTAGTVTLDFNYANLIHVLNTGTPSGSVSASYSFDFTIATLSPLGTVVFDSAPSSVNATAGLTSAGEIFVPPGGSPMTGSVSITSGTLAAGTYQATISGAERVFLRTVPEPSSFVLLGLGGIGFGLMARRRLTRKLELN